MKFNPTPLPGVIHIELDTYRDERGYFLENHHQEKYAKAGILGPFVQDNISSSTRGTLRGLHAQLTHPQGKLVHIISGEIWDVAVDVRPDSPTYKKWFGIMLSSKKPAQLYVPIGYAHGFCVISQSAEVLYKCTDLYDPSNAIHLLWNDPELSISWPIQNPTLSPKDRDGESLQRLQPKLARYFRWSKSK
jgi:dTDP-4-dehydrorhamnose 3,5-epimerase